MTHDELSKLIDQDVNASLRKATEQKVIAAHSTMVAQLAAIKPKPISTFPYPEEFEERAAHMRDIARAVDTYILALGQDAKENSPSVLDLSLFKTPLMDAIDGNSTHELESIAEELRNEMIDEGEV